jgi:pimeloyl-ACP methyl ester carboxylesterase
MSREPLPRETLLRQLGAIGAHDRGDGLGPPRQVTRIIVGERDFLTHPGDAARLARLLPGSVVEVLPDAGHSLWVEQPAAFAAAVLRGLAAP